MADAYLSTDLCFVEGVTPFDEATVRIHAGDKPQMVRITIAGLGIITSGPDAVDLLADGLEQLAAKVRHAGELRAMQGNPAAAVEVA